MPMTDSPINVTRAVIDAAMTVHSLLGPGLLESAYVDCLGRRASLSRIPRGNPGPGLDSIPWENHQDRVPHRPASGTRGRRGVKAVQKLTPVFEAQLLSHLRLGRYKAGLLINFHSLHLRDGIKRMVNNLTHSVPTANYSTAGDAKDSRGTQGLFSVHRESTAPRGDSVGVPARSGRHPRR